MGAQGRFILSLDCEGKWGIADHLKPIDDVQLSGKRLVSAYQDIVDLLDRFEIPATFAVVGLFSLSPDELRMLPHAEIAGRLPYTVEAMRRLSGSDFDGWHGEWLRAMLGTAHEVASHGITHTPFDQMTIDDVKFELSLMSVDRGQTFIFPRNKVAHLDLLEQAGFVGYRTAKRSGRVGRYLGELNIFEKAEPVLPVSDFEIAPIAAGHFINWKSGVRAAIPVAVTRKRAAAMLDDAVRTGGVVHYWTHPENIASAPATLDCLSAILQEVKIRRDQGEIRVETQMSHIVRSA